MELQFSYFFAYLDIHQTETSYKDAATGKNICTVRDAPKTQKGIRSAEIPADASWIVPRIKEMTPADSKWLFMTRTHKNGSWVRVRIEYFRKALYKACRAVGIPERGLHCLRRTFGSIVAEAGTVSAKTLSDQMGHTSISTTYRYYVKKHKSNEHMREELSKVEGLKNLTKLAEV